MKKEGEENMAAQEKFAQALREARGEQEIVEFAKKIGFSKSSVRRWEKGHPPTQQTVDKISHILGWGQRKRVKIDYPLIYKMEDEYGQLQNVPDNHPELLKLQRYMNSKW